MIAAFQAADSQHPVLVLMIRAGGVGINLTAANHVIHYDRWWNPAVENQATDRVYRIGQTRDVTVYKLITTGTIEEKIDQLLREKAELAETMLQADDEDLLHKLTLKDWERLLF
jgi:SNF2 family DNA or RNA helicase